MNIDKEYLEKNLKALDGWGISVANLTTRLSKEFLGNIDDNVKTDLEGQIKDILTEYKNDKTGSVTMDDVYNSLTNLSTKKEDDDETLDYDKYYKEEPEKTVQPVYRPNTGNTTGDIVDFDTDTASEAAQMAKGAADIISGSTIGIPGKVEPFCGDLDSAANNAVSKVESSLTDFTSAMGTISNKVEGLDDVMANIDLDWGNINKWKSYDRNNNSEMHEATEDFFKACGAIPVDGKVTIKVPNGDGTEKTYTYDMNTRMLNIDGKDVRCKFYVPDNATDYSHLNTYTYFVADSYADYISNTTDITGRDGYPPPDTSSMKANAILIQIDKNDETVSYKKGDNRFMYDESKLTVPETTRFINALAQTDLENNHCRNIIAGDSKFGAYALEIAAESGDLYKSVYCVNNAICVDYKNPNNEIEVNGKKLRGNVSGSDKTQLTREQLEKLSGKDIYMIYASGDQNQDHNQKSGWAKSCKNEDSYALTGLDYICNFASKKTNINVIYFDRYSHTGEKGYATKYDKLKSLYQEKADKYENLSFHDDNWERFSRNCHFSHTDGNFLVTELLEADVTNCNYYFNDGSYNVEQNNY